VLDHVALGIHPLGFDGIEPGALGGQQERQNPNAFAGLIHLLIVLANPGANGLALMPGGIIPDQEPVCLALQKQRQILREAMRRWDEAWQETVDQQQRQRHLRRQQKASPRLRSLVSSWLLLLLQFRPPAPKPARLKVSSSCTCCHFAWLLSSFCSSSLETCSCVPPTLSAKK